MIYKTHSAKELQRLAALFAKRLTKKAHKRHALVLALTGDLGSGKTTFTQGFLRALGVRSKITSPTFVLMKKFEIRNPKLETNPRFRKTKFQSTYHVDAYRIKKVNELTQLGLKEILADPQNIVLIEWAEKAKKILPKNSIWLKFEHGQKENERIIRILF